MPHNILTDWISELDHFSNDKKDVYFLPQYAKLYESTNEKAVCFKFEREKNLFLFPFLKREFEFDGKRYFDFETAYGYGGPIANTNDYNFIEEGLKAFFKHCQENGFVCGFTRFHPLLQNSIQFNNFGQVLLDRQTIAIDLTKTEDEIWMNSLTGKNRSAIRKAISNGLRFEADYTFTYLDYFINLYNMTMNKLGADHFFIFKDDYYRNWVQNIPNSFLGVVFHEKRIISAAIFFYSDTFGHYHLAGSDPEYLSLNPNNLMLWEATKELKQKGIRSLHLGGGSNGNPDNSLFNFKSRFSPLLFDFNIGKMVFNSEIYQKICNKWEAENPDKVVKFKNLLLKYKY